MSHRLFYSLVSLGIVLMIALALVWPQGEGAMSPAPVGHPIPETDKQKMLREKEEARLLTIKSDAQKSAARQEAQKPQPIQTQ
jgi:hypothetical protein